MKKITIFIVLLFLFLVGGVIFGISDDKINKDSMKFKDMIPNPEEYFFSTEFEGVTREDQYILYIDYASEDEWNKYISKIREEEYWTNEYVDSEYSWYAYSNDKKYKLMLDRYGNDHVYMTIIVKINEKR